MLYVDIPIVPGITIVDAEITGVTNKTYTGKGLQQDPVVKIGSQQLVKGTDYTLTYANNKNPGTAFVLINGIGSYRGVTGKRFTIYYKDVPASHSYKNAVYWASEQEITAGYSDGTFGVKQKLHQRPLRNLHVQDERPERMIREQIPRIIDRCVLIKEFEIDIISDGLYYL